jgi:hypothetical protein
LAVFEVDDQLEFGQLLDGEVGGICAFEESVREARCAAVLVGVVHSVDDQAPDELHGCIDRRQPMLGRRGQRPELQCPLRAFEEDAVEQQRVEMRVQIQSAPEALDHGHASRPSRITCPRARCRWKPSNTRTDTPSTARASA